MKNRPFWEKLIEELWQHRSIIWLSGVRRVGKTSLCKNLQRIEYYDCELPRVRLQLAEPELFLKNTPNPKRAIVFDEIHRLANPSEILKIAADHFPLTKIIATGSSTLGASSKFADTLTGRKSDLWLTPLLLEECEIFDNTNIQHRFFHGGLPSFFMGENFLEKDFSEWLDSYWAKDIQELFRIEKRYSFQKFVELLFAQSGGIFEATRFSTPCEVSRTTIANYLAVLETTFVVHIIRPFSTNLATEIVTAPKIYAFDTGFVCYANGWTEVRQSDFGLLWEHCVLNELQGKTQTRKILYWRDKQGHEIDFVYIKNRNYAEPIAIECKWTAANFDPTNLKIFRKRYPKGINYVVSHDTEGSFERQYDGILVTFVNAKDIVL